MVSLREMKERFKKTAPAREAQARPAAPATPTPVVTPSQIVTHGSDFMYHLATFRLVEKKGSVPHYGVLAGSGTFRFFVNDREAKDGKNPPFGNMFVAGSKWDADSQREINTELGKIIPFWLDEKGEVLQGKWSFTSGTKADDNVITLTHVVELRFSPDKTTMDMFLFPAPPRDGQAPARPTTTRATSPATEPADEEETEIPF